MKESQKRLLVLSGLIAGFALLAPFVPRVLKAANAEQPPKKVIPEKLGRFDRVVGTPPPLLSHTLAPQRGCRDGGIGGIDRTNPSWVSVSPTEAPTVLEGIVRISKVTHEDFPANHDSHDWNFLVAPDSSYNGLMSDGNEIENNERLIECEWETKHFPDQFLPSPGDRIWTMGRWIFDCGHPPDYRSEIHPAKATAFTRLEPHIFRGDSAPSFTNRTYIFLNGQGGYYYDPLGGANYEFYVPLPPKPSPNAIPRAEVVSVPFGGVAPQLTLEPAQNRVKVVYPLLGFRDSAQTRWNLYANPLNQRPPQNTIRFGAIIASGWREATLTKGYRVFRVTLNSLKINHDHDPGASGEWVMWVRINGTWVRLGGLGDVDDGQTIAINRSVVVTVPDNSSINLQTTGWESDPIEDTFGVRAAGTIPGAGALDNNDKLGTFVKRFVAVNNFGVGNHDDPSTRNGDEETANDYQLRYQILEIGRIPAGTINRSGVTQRKFVTVTINSIKVLDESEGFGRGDGEMVFTISVNNQTRRFPSSGHKSMGKNDVATLNMAFSTTLTLTDVLNIQVRGIEDDSPDANDEMGLVGENFTFAQNFGAGTRTVRSILPGNFQVTYTVKVVDIQ